MDWTGRLPLTRSLPSFSSMERSQSRARSALDEGGDDAALAPQPMSSPLLPPRPSPRGARQGAFPFSRTQVPHCAIRHHSWLRLASVGRFRRRAPCGLVSRSGRPLGTSSQAAIAIAGKPERRSNPPVTGPPGLSILDFLGDSRERGEEKNGRRMMMYKGHRLHDRFPPGEISWHGHPHGDHHLKPLAHR